MPTRGMWSDEVNKGGASGMTSEQREIFSEIYIDNWPKLLRYAKANKWCVGAVELGRAREVPVALASHGAVVPAEEDAAVFKHGKRGLVARKVGQPFRDAS